MRGAEIIKGALRLIGRTFPPEPGDRVVVLCYHSIHPSVPFRSATPQLFADHIAWLREYCECIPFGRLLPLDDRSGSDRPVVSITFDDGYADNHEYAFPVLADAGVPATFFLTAGFVEGDELTLERFRRLRKTDPSVIRPLAWDQVREMHDGGMEIGAHTYSHPNLARLDSSRLEREVGYSKRVIEDRVGDPITMMAYPFGRPRVHVTGAVVEAARHAGYGSAASIGGRGVRRTDPPLGIPRIFVANDSVDTLREKVLGTWDLIGTVREKMPLAITRAISPADFRV